LVLQAAARPARFGPSASVRVGFTASRKVGNAVVRNRAKRRLRAAAAAVVPALGRPGTDYVLIARGGTALRPFAALLADLEAGLRRIERGAARGSIDPGRGDRG
jgi:ribonuclease P protein component